MFTYKFKEIIKNKKKTAWPPSVNWCISNILKEKLLKTVWKFGMLTQHKLSCWLKSTKNWGILLPVIFCLIMVTLINFIESVLTKAQNKINEIRLKLFTGLIENATKMLRFTISQNCPWLPQQIPQTLLQNTEDQCKHGQQQHHHSAKFLMGMIKLPI